MADKMAESGKEPGKDVLDDGNLADDPIISALQTLRATIDDIQYNDSNHGTDKIESSITANTAKTGISDEQTAAIVANTNARKEKDLSLTEGKTVKMSVVESRGSYSLLIQMIHGSVKKTATITLR